MPKFLHTSAYTAYTSHRLLPCWYSHNNVEWQKTGSANIYAHLSLYGIHISIGYCHADTAIIMLNGKNRKCQYLCTPQPIRHTHHIGYCHADTAIIMSNRKTGSANIYAHFSLYGIHSHRLLPCWYSHNNAKSQKPEVPIFLHTSHFT